MINLLPPNEEKELCREKRKKLIIILGSILLVSLLCLILILLSIKSYIWGEVELQKIILEQTRKEYEASDFPVLEETLRKYNKILLELGSFYDKQIYLTEILGKISNIQRPDGLYLTNLSLNREEDDKITAAISGFSETRDNLSLFKENLEKEKDFINPYFSPSSWIKPTDVDFYLTFEITK